MNETSETRRRRRTQRAARRAKLRRTVLFGGAVALGAALPAVGLAATAQAADPDTRAPESTAHLITEPPSGWFQSSTPVAFTADDFGGAGIATIAVVVDGAGKAYPGDATGWFTVEGDGVHTIGYRAIDNAGNLEPWRTVVRRIDGGAPTVTVPADGVFEIGAAATLEYGCGDAVSGIASCTAAVPSGGALDTSTAGVFTVPVTATDVAGNTFTAVYTYSVVADTTAPTVALQIAPEPASGWYASYLGIVVAAEDPSGIASVHWSTDGAVSANGDVVGEGGWAGFDLNFDGVTEVRGWAFDSAGNRGDTERRTVRIDTVAPRIDLASPELPNPVLGADAGTAAPELEFEQGEQVPLDYDCVDEHSGIASCLAEDELPEPVADALPTDELGDHVVTLRALDVAGNESMLELRYRVVEAEGEPGGGGNGGGEQPGGGSGGTGGDGAQGPGRPGGGSDEVDSRGGSGSLAETGFPVLPGILIVAGLFAAGAILLTTRPTSRRRLDESRNGARR